MRDTRFVAVHRGGPLIKEHHRLLMIWACDCAEHVFPLLGEPGPDERLVAALKVGRAWERAETSVGVAMRASLSAHAAARASLTPTAVAVARAVGQAVATAHMADHSLGAAWYALKGVQTLNQSVDDERKWQNGQLPDALKALVLSARSNPKFGQL